MASWTSLVVLSALAVSTLSLPGPDGAYNIPGVGTGRRSQYYVLHSDGTYKYGHDTGKGAFESAKLNRPGDLDGEFGYTDDDGNNVYLQYKSGEGGFVARGDHLPEPHPDFNAAHAEAQSRPPFVDPLADSNTDASYNFQFAEEGQSRSEQSDADGNVRGSYTYTDEEGNTRTFSYTAGRETGFVIEGNDLPQGPPESGLTPAATRLSSSANRITSSANRVSSSANRVTSSSQFSGSHRVGTSSTGTRRTPGTSYSAANRASTTSSRPISRLPSRPFGAAHRAGSTTSFSGSAASQRGGVNSDGSYSFSYNAGDHSRSESADANLNIEGQFSFVADDGVQRSVSYESGANRGFQASGDHLPTPPESPFRNRFSTSTKTQSTYRAPTASRIPTASRAPTPSRVQTVSRTPSVRGSTSSTSFSSHRPTSTRSQQTYSGSSSSSSSSSSRVPFEEANTRSELRPDGSYDFAYETSSHSRAESGDSDNNVDGKFDFVADDDGQRREIKYEAGSDTGFIAEGAHIPIGPEVPGAPSGQPTGRIVPVQEVPFIDPLADTGLDASYNFAFESEQYSRSEVADAEGNVQGTYTVVDDDGTRRTYRFRAGKGVGFETEEVGVSRGSPPSRPATSSFSGSASSSFSGTNTAASPSSFRGGSSTYSSYSPGSSSSSSSFRGTGSSSSSSSFRGTGTSSSSNFRGGSGLRTPSYTASSANSRRPSTSSSFSSASRTPLRNTFKPTSTQEVFPGFKLHQYDASKNPDKFGYVLTFDN